MTNKNTSYFILTSPSKTTMQLPKLTLFAPKPQSKQAPAPLYTLKWRDEEVLRFLQNYREHECLWDISNINYRNNKARNAAYLEILDDMEMPGLTVQTVVSKIKSLRTTYKSERNKILAAGKTPTGENVYKPQMFWFNTADEFLCSTYEVRETPPQLVDSPISSCETEAYSRNDEEIEIKLEDIDVTDHEVKDVERDSSGSQHSVEEVNQYSVFTNLLKQARDAAIKNLPLDQRIYIENKIHKPFQSSNGKDASVPSTSQSPQDLQNKSRRKRSASSDSSEGSKPERRSKVCRSNGEDEYDLFGKMIAVQLRRMPREKAFTCQQSLLDVMRKNT